MLEWIKVSENSPYFITQSGLNWTPVGQNDAIAWPDLIGIYKKRDLPSAIRYFEMMQDNGVNCMRLMLEYCQTNQYYLEKPAGKFLPPMVQFWDDIFSLCKNYGIRILLTPFDTFWMWRRWKHHPYNKSSGGPCKQRSKWLSCPEMRIYIKNRLSFVTDRWGGSGVIFAWDLWNEIHPVHVNHETAHLVEFVEDIGTFLKEQEHSIHGMTHLQTVSVYGHELLQSQSLSSMLFRNPVLDFASTHFYEKGTIDNPRDTITPALATGKLVREALDQIDDNRPFMDTEHGPIYAYKKKKAGLPEAFDDEYFIQMQWAHLASGACGGGMRWPYRQPHTLTNGMRKSQASLSAFAKLVDWKEFKRKNISENVLITPDDFHSFCCGSGTKVLLWLLKKKMKKVRKKDSCEGAVCCILIEQMEPGTYQVICWDTVNARIATTQEVEVSAEVNFTLRFVADDKDLLLLAKKIFR